MQLRITKDEILSLLKQEGIDLYYQPTDLHSVRLGINSVLSIPVNVALDGTRLDLRYTSGAIAGRVINYFIGLFRGKFGGVEVNLEVPGVIGVNLSSINGADKFLETVSLTDLFFSGESLVIVGEIKV